MVLQIVVIQVQEEAFDDLLRPYYGAHGIALY
jgi:hypothetical protein